MKIKYVFLVLVGLVILSACEKQSDLFAQEREVQLDITNNNIVFPEKYFETVDNVSYDLTLEVPEDLNINNFRKVEVEGELISNAEAALQLWADDREPVFSHVTPADEYSPEEYSYMYDDDLCLNIGGSYMTYSTADGSHYPRVFQRISEDPVACEELPTDFSFATSEECIVEISDVLKTVGFDVDFSAAVFSLDAERAKSWEEHLTMDDEREEALYREVWTEEDNAYIISAYQTYNDLPVFNEILALNQSMAVDSPYNAPITAIYTARGLVELTVMAQYQFRETDQRIELLPFETIIETISEKLNNILSETSYEVYKAKLFLMVRYVNATDYEALPVWYFEAREAGSDQQMVLLVDAESGKEINIGL